MNKPLLSILMPAVFDRDSRVLCESITMQVQQENLPVELLVLFDNRKRSTGLKRNVLLGAARGQYVMHLDDDDDLAPDALPKIIAAIEHADNPDVISFDSKVTIDDGNPFRVRTGMSHPNEQCATVDGKWQDIRRKPWHWCAWKHTFVADTPFPDGYIDDDAYWLEKLWVRNPSEFHVNAMLHHYRYNSKTSLSQQGTPTVVEKKYVVQTEGQIRRAPGDLSHGIDLGEPYDIGAL